MVWSDEVVWPRLVWGGRGGMMVCSQRGRLVRGQRMEREHVLLVVLRREGLEVLAHGGA